MTELACNNQFKNIGTSSFLTYLLIFYITCFEGGSHCFIER